MNVERSRSIVRYLAVQLPWGSATPRFSQRTSFGPHGPSVSAATDRHLVRQMSSAIVPAVFHRERIFIIVLIPAGRLQDPQLGEPFCAQTFLAAAGPEGRSRSRTITPSAISPSRV